MKKLITTVAFLVPFLAGAAPAGADLLDLGSGLIYDRAQGITWLDQGFDPGFDDRIVTEQWVENLTYGGITDWRAPSLTEILHLGDDFRAGGTYSTAPFTEIGVPAVDFRAFYLTSTPAGAGELWAYSLSQDRLLAAEETTPIWGVAVTDGRPSSAPVPEPGTLLLAGTGAACLLVVSRNRALQKE
ncbi:MAG: PEP-CTERM sorting domain-containing protein [Desulfobacteraceae bacterium]|nr:PEP-CTERM sorting domain-containing protein [Desulfobacteraceae bacterium]